MPPPDVFTMDILRDYLLVGAALFVLGMLGFLSRRNLIVMFLSAEMMLQGTALSLVAFGRYHGNWTGQIFTILILTVAASEASIAPFGARRLRSEAHIPVIAGIALAFLFSLGTLAAAGPHQTWTVLSWMTASDLEIPIEVRVDGLSTMMLAMVTFVSLLVAVFAV